MAGSLYEKLDREYIELLSSDKPGSEKWWELEKRIKKDKKSPGVIAEMDKSQVLWQLRDLLINNVISPEDLDGFSEGLRERALIIYMDFLMDEGSEE